MNPESLIIEQTKDWAILKKGKSLCIRFNDAIGYVNRNNLKNSGLHQRVSNIIIYSFYLDRIYRSGGFKVHGCGIRGRYGGYLFIGPSGAGKSTIASLINNKKLVINDDEIVITKNGSRFVMLGIVGGDDVSNFTVIKYKLNKIFFLKKSDCNKVTPLKQIDSLLYILKNSKWSFAGRLIDKRKFLRTCLELTKRLPCYLLGFLPSRSIWRDLNNINFYK